MMIALDIARAMGAFQPSLSRDNAMARHAAWQRWQAAQRRLTQLSAQAAQERQLSRRVEVNLAIQGVRQELGALRCTLGGGRTP